jgi:predicted CXXCH cytochrome family protein
LRRIAIRSVGVRRGRRGAGNWLAAVVALLALVVLTAPDGRAQAKNSCLECHALLPEPLGVSAEEFSSSIHAQKGLTCTSCHGGDASTDDLDKSMGAAAGFRRNVGRAQIPALCARCHSDAAYMRTFNPSLRTDQFSQYQTSVHGKRLAMNDTKVAVCTDCHTMHNIRPPNDPQSSVYPLNVAQTCGHCHADAEYMKDYKIPTNQLALYTGSVHHEALAVRGDSSAPTCSTCHGSHGAAPPGVASVERVCATCHAFQQQLFDSGAHKDVFAALDLSGCVVCHSNHGIQHPTDAMLGTGTESVCVKCHSAGDPAYDAAGTMHAALTKLDQDIVRSDEILTRAENAGVEVGQSKLALSDARDSLTKARVAIHSVNVETVDQNIQGGLKVTEMTYQAGLNAMAELRYRRVGLAISVGIIILVLIAIALLIRRLESQGTSAGT